jgi:hypothetical protein
MPLYWLCCRLSVIWPPTSYTFHLKYQRASSLYSLLMTIWIKTMKTRAASPHFCHFSNLSKSSFSLALAGVFSITQASHVASVQPLIGQDD